MRNKKKESPNYLEYVPKHNDKYTWEINEQGEVTIFVENKGVFASIAQKYFNKPKVSQIHLEGIGNFIWPLIDGERSILALGEFVKEHFGEEAEPLYPRLAQYIRSLESYDFIKVNAVGNHN